MEEELVLADLVAEEVEVFQQEGLVLKVEFYP